MFNTFRTLFLGLMIFGFCTESISSPLAQINEIGIKLVQEKKITFYDLNAVSRQLSESPDILLQIIQEADINSLRPDSPVPELIYAWNAVKEVIARASTVGSRPVSALSEQLAQEQHLAAAGASFWEEDEESNARHARAAAALYFARVQQDGKTVEQLPFRVVSPSVAQAVDYFPTTCQPISSPPEGTIFLDESVSRGTRASELLNREFINRLNIRQIAEAEAEEKAKAEGRRIEEELQF